MEAKPLFSAASSLMSAEKRKKVSLRVVAPPEAGPGELDGVFVAHFPSGAPPELSAGGDAIRFEAFQREGVAQGQRPQLMLRGRTVRAAMSRRCPRRG